MTEQEMQERILTLEDENTNLKTQVESIATMKKEIDDLKLHNQKLFLRVQAGTNSDDKNDDNKEPEHQSLEDFAKTLKL